MRIIRFVFTLVAFLATTSVSFAKKVTPIDIYKREILEIKVAMLDSLMEYGYPALSSDKVMKDNISESKKLLKKLNFNDFNASLIKTYIAQSKILMGASYIPYVFKSAKNILLNTDKTQKEVLTMEYEKYSKLCLMKESFKKSPKIDEILYCQSIIGADYVYLNDVWIQDDSHPFLKILASQVGLLDTLNTIYGNDERVISAGAFAMSPLFMSSIIGHYLQVITTANYELLETDEEKEKYKERIDRGKGYLIDRIQSFAAESTEFEMKFLRKEYDNEQAFKIMKDITQMEYDFMMILVREFKFYNETAKAPSDDYIKNFGLVSN